MTHEAFVDKAFWFLAGGFVTGAVSYLTLWLAFLRKAVSREDLDARSRELRSEFQHAMERHEEESVRNSSRIDASLVAMRAEVKQIGDDITEIRVAVARLAPKDVHEGSR